MIYLNIKKNRSNENFQMISLLVITALVLYYFSIIKPLFFAVILYFFYKSKKNYFWLVYFIIVILDVGGFFISLTNDVIKIGPIEISLVLLYSIISYIKVKKEKIKSPFLFKNNIQIWFSYLFFLLFLGFFIIGNDGGGVTGFRNIYLIGLMLPVLLTMFTTHKFIISNQAFLLFSKLMFLSIILNVMGQLIHLKLGYPVYSYFDNYTGKWDSIVRDYSKSLIRPVFGVFNSLIVVFLTLYWRSNGSNRISKHYLTFIQFLSLFSIFITATRGWIISVLFLIISSFFIMKIANKLIVLRVLFISICSFFIFYTLIDSFKIQVDLVADRLTTLNNLLSGDLTAGGTNSRLTTRSKPVMALFYQRPIFGNGFSTDGCYVSDPHVGNQNILMSGGIVGFLIIMLLWLKIISTTIKKHFKSISGLNYNGEILLIIPFLLSILIIHSSSMSYFGYLSYMSYPEVLFALSVFIGIINRVLLNSKEEFLYGK